MSSSLPQARLVRSAALSAVGAAIGIFGCGAPPEGDYDSPHSDGLVVSGTPRTDSAAFQSSASKLSQARFDRIERGGPQPTLLADATSGASSDDSSRSVVGADGTPEPVTLSRRTGTSQAPTSRPAVEAESRVELPDGRIRLIWGLQGFGGPRVTTQHNNASRRQISLQPADLGPLVQLVQTHLGDGGTVVPLVAENKLVIICRPSDEPTVLGLLRDIDRPARQVEITAKIFEVRHDFDYQQGARILLNRIAEDGTQSALSTFQTQKLLDAAAGATPFSGSVISLMQTLEDAGIGIEASFELLAESGLINVVSEPRLTVAEGQTGYMLAGQELPIQSAEITNDTLKAKTDYKPVGVQLYVTPQVIGVDHVKLHTVSVVSSVAGFTPLPTLRGEKSNPLLLNPVLDSREAETNVTVNTGDTLVISGMRMVRTTTREDKVPGLGDVPILGHFFKSHRTQRRLTDLYFFLTPTLVQDDTSLAMIE